MTPRSESFTTLDTQCFLGVGGYLVHSALSTIMGSVNDRKKIYTSNNTLAGGKENYMQDNTTKTNSYTIAGQLKHVRHEQVLCR